MRWLLVFFGGFFIGALAVVTFEALGVYFFIKRLNRKIQQEESKSSSHKDLDPQQSLDYAYNKKGVVWVLESVKLPKSWLPEKLPKDQKKKKDIFEVNPVKKYAKIKDRSLILTDSDGSPVAIPLKGCTIEAVSASDLSSRKWAKRFPIKVESKTSEIYNASKTVYVYLDTSWEKESWCKALRLASCDDKERLNWFTKLREEFHSYLTSLNTGYPSFMKPSAGFNAEPVDRMTKIDGSASKVRTFLKKLARKASKCGVENRGTFSLGREERKINDKSRFYQDPILTSNLVKTTPTAKAPLNSEEENMAVLSSATFSRAASQSHISVVSDQDSDDRLNIDEGTLCWNLLVSRIFFDAKSNAMIKSSVQARIQRTLSNIRTPNYIGEVICTDLGFGSLPPYIHGIRVLPTDMNEVWAWEVDVEYSGGFVLDIETRLEVQNLQKDMVDTNSEASSVGDVSSDLLEGFEYLGKQLNLSEGTADAQEWRDEGNLKLDGLKNCTSCLSTSTNVSRWKSILNSIAKQVSQVPLSLSIRVASLRGTLRVNIKPPPSDQLWYGFTSMPDIEFDLESSVGEHKISSAHTALFLISRFKASIKETMVLPNCESLCIPWMLAEKNDWVPRTVAPFMWLNREATSDHASTCEAPSSPSEEAKPEEAHWRASNYDPESKHLKTKNAESSQQSSSSSDASESSLNSTKPSLQSSESLQDLTSPLLASFEPQEICQQSRDCNSECQSPSRSLSLAEIQNQAVEDDDDSRPQRMGRRARILGLRKKVGEKLEEKRRHIEEKGRNIVEKMRGP